MDSDFEIHSEGFKYLKNKHENILNETEQKIETFKKYKDDYQKLRTKLSTVADERTYNLMVPLATAQTHCPLAYIPGYIKHTNEVLVLLGDNWFVERTTKQSIEIIERRVKKIDEMVDELTKEKEQYESWIKMTDEIIDQQKGVEILEEYDEEKEKIWREKHRENIRAHKKLESQQRKLINLNIAVNDEDNDEEDVVDDVEMNKCSDQMSSYEKDETKRKKSVTFDLSTIDESLEIITDKHVYPSAKPIYSSILKEKSNVEVKEEPTKRPDHNYEQPFTGQITERPVHLGSSQIQTDNKTDTSKQKISKFKARRK